MPCTAPISTSSHVFNSFSLFLGTYLNLDVYEFGMRPANFLDIGGGAEAEHIKEALEFVMSDPKVKKVFINIFGGITRADEVARGIVMALKDLGDKTKPLVVRLTGTNEELGREILKEVGIEPYTDPLQALEHLRKL